MKKIWKIIVLLVAIFTSIDITRAKLNCDDRLTLNTPTTTGYDMNFDGMTNPFKKFTFKNGSKEIKGYCRNAGLFYTSNYKCNRVVFDPTEVKTSKNDDKNGAYDAGIITILKKSTDNAYDDKYVSVNIALRVYEMLWEEYDSNGSNEKPFNKAHRFFVNEWNDELSSLLMETVGKVRSDYSSIHTVTGITGPNSEIIISNAKTYVIDGLNAAKKYLANGAPSIKIGNPVKTVNGTNVTVSHTINTSGISTSEISAKIECKNCSSIGLGTPTVTTSINSSTSMTININFNYNLTNCNASKTVKYDIVLDSNNELFKYQALELNRGVPSSDYQTFYVLKENEFKEYKTVNLCSKGNDCTAKFDKGSCSKESDSVDYIEGYSGTDCNANNLDIMSCIIGGEDVAGNSLQATNIMSGNEYCSVWCKEDYHFGMPGNINTESGRYIKLNATAKGTKTCYSSKIDHNKFDNYISTANAELIKRFNEMSEAKARLAAINSAITQSKEVPLDYYAYMGDLNNNAINLLGNDNNQNNYQLDFVRMVIDNPNDKPIIPSNEKPKKEETKKKETKKEETKKEEEYKPAWRTVNCTVNYINYSYEYTYCSLNNGVVTCDKKESLNNTISEVASLNTSHKCQIDKDLSEKINAAKPDVNTLTSSFNAKKSEIESKVKLFKSCGSWINNMKYNFEPEMNFWYSETYINNAITTKMNRINENNNSTISLSSCNGTVGNSYESCSVNWTTSVSNQNKSVVNCDDNSCSIKIEVVPQANYIKKSITSEASFELPTQFYNIYPTGGIVAAKSDTENDIKNNEKSIENSKALRNALPVSFNTKTGSYDYSLYVSNLGEYYDSDKLGRIWGSNNSTINVLTNKNCENGAVKYSSNVGDSAYVCKYNIPQTCTKPDGTEVDMTNCITGEKDSDTCKKELCCPDCPDEINYVCTKKDGTKVDITSCVNTSGNAYKCSKEICCPDSGKCLPEVVYRNKYKYRTITTKDLNPNNRKLGPNWKYDDSNISTAAEMKASVTTNEIIVDGEKIYDESEGKYVMKVTLDSALINKIKELNKTEKNNYVNNTLDCYDYEQKTGEVYKNIFCYSTYLDKLVNDNSSKNKIIFAEERPLSDSDRKRSQNYKYWTVWTDAVANPKWDITTTNIFSYSKSNYDNIGIGPSWK